MGANSIEESSLQAEYIDVWLSGNAGGELSAKDFEIYTTLFTNRQNNAFYNWIALARIDTQYEGVASQGLARFLYQNPGARAEWNRRKEQSGTLRIRLDGAFPAFAVEVDADLKQFPKTLNHD